MELASHNSHTSGAVTSSMAAETEILFAVLCALSTHHHLLYNS